MEGRGVFKWPCGKSYEGSYKNNKREGFGVFSWADGRKFKGDWIRGKQQGNGEFFIPECKHWYKGFWEAGKLINYENPDDKSIIDCNRYNVDHEITVNLGEKENMSKNDGNDDNHLSGSGNENKSQKDQKLFSPLQSDYNFNLTSNNNLLNSKINDTNNDINNSNYQEINRINIIDFFRLKSKPA